ncbi:MAG: hypothetical protein J5965_20320, partial [Aeriscardovia sp.]|nr:hypothetical protein [Aeriscardovia sp.]
MQKYKIKSEIHYNLRKVYGEIGKITFLSVFLLSSGTVAVSSRTVEMENQRTTVKFSMSNVTMKSVIDRIEKNDGYVFIYNDEVRGELNRRV